MNYRQQRFLRQLLYTLKRNYGDTVTLYHGGASSTNIETGARTVVQSWFTIKKAIVLPSKLGRETQLGITEISANKKFMYGMSYDASVRTFVLDGRDLPSNFELNKDDWIRYENRRYNIKDITEFEQFAGWIVVAKYDIGSTAEQDITIQVGDNIGVTDEPTAT